MSFYSYTCDFLKAMNPQLALSGSEIRSNFMKTSKYTYETNITDSLYSASCKSNTYYEE
jgi:hypothetical protein